MPIQNTPKVTLNTLWSSTDYPWLLLYPWLSNKVTNISKVSPSFVTNGSKDFNYKWDDSRVTWDDPIITWDSGVNNITNTIKPTP